MCHNLRKAYLARRNEQKIGAKLAKEFDVEQRTLSLWISKWRVDINYDPSDKSNRSKNRRVFTDDQEEQMAEEIMMKYVYKNRYFSDKTFRNFAVLKYLEFNPDAEHDEFQCSDHFIYDFKRRHSFSSRLAHFVRRKPAPSTDVQKNFIQKITRPIYDKNKIVINADETSWSVLPKRITTWAPIGTDHVIIENAGSTKFHITVMCSIEYRNSKKLSLLFSAMTVNIYHHQDEKRRRLVNKNGKR